MGIAQTFRARLNAYARADIASRKSGVGYPNPGWAPPAGWVGASASGVTITADRANTVAAWNLGVRVISEDVAGLPLILYRRLDRGRERAIDHPLYRLLHDEPNPDMTSFVFRELLQSHLLTWGNAYAEKELNASGQVVGLWPLRPDRMEVGSEAGRRTYDYRVRDESRPIRLARERVFHIPGLGFDGVKGHSILSMARETLGATIALREYGSRVVRNDARPGVILVHPRTLSDKAKANLREGWDDRHGGLNNAGRTAVLEEDIKVTSLGLPREDLLFLESQQWHVTEMARWFRLTPHKLGDLSHATFSNVEELGIDHVTSTLRSWLVRWEQQLAKDVIADLTLHVEHLMDALLRGRTLERAQANTLKINAGAMVPNEWRDQDNQNPLDWGDDRVNTPNNSALPGGPA